MTTEEWNDKPAGGPTMTPTTLAETILRDVRSAIHKAIHDPGETEGYRGDRTLTAWQTDAVMRAVADALTAALDPAIAERAGEALEGVTPGPWTLCRLADQTPYSIQASYGCVNGLSALFTLAHINAPDEAEVGMTDGAFDRETADANARFIAWCREGVPALLAQNAALRAERDAARGLLDKTADMLKRVEDDRVEKISRLTAAEAKVKKLRAERDDALTFLDNAVSKAPEPLKALGKYLAGLLDEDQWPTAEQHLNAAAKASQDAEAVAEKLRGALQIAKSIFDTPIGLRRLGIDPNTDERLIEFRALTTEAGE